MSKFQRNFPAAPQTMLYQPGFITSQDRKEILDYLRSLHPIWEMRFSDSNPPPAGQPNRQLLRPVYWLGNWQFACLNYYHPPKGIFNRCVEAEPFPQVLARLVEQAEQKVHSHFSPRDIPKGWELNTCLINYYGSKKEGDKWVDVARVGEHKDFEPGPVASMSLGERAFFQFVTSEGKNHQSKVVMNQWLEDGSLQIFGGDRMKKHLFHRVQRVEKKGIDLGLNIEGFQTRRINFTFRYVPREHFVEFSKLPENLRRDVQPYVEELGRHSEFFRHLLPFAGT